jgi:hypothetical protein
MGLTVTQLELVEKSGSTQLKVTYTEHNGTPDKELLQGSFKLFMTNGESSPQYGGFNKLYPGDTKTRSYTWEWVKGKSPWLIEWGAGFSATAPTLDGIKFKVGPLGAEPLAYAPLDEKSSPSFLGPDISIKAEAKRFTVTCSECKGRVMAIYVGGVKSWSKLIQSLQKVTVTLPSSKGAKLVTVKLSGGLTKTATFKFK